MNNLNNANIPDGKIKAPDGNEKRAAERKAQKNNIRNELQSKILNKYPKLASISNNSGRGWNGT